MYKRQVLNDVDNDIVNLYICVLKEFEELTNHIYWYPRSRTLFDNFKEEIKNSKLLFDETNRSELKIKSDAGILIAKKIDNSLNS